MTDSSKKDIVREVHTALELQQIDDENDETVTLTSLQLEMQPLQAESQDSKDVVYPVKAPLPKQPQNWRERVEEFLFPPALPRECQLLRPENIAIPACYLLVGLLQGLSSPLINTFPLDLKATEAQQTTISSIRSLPASFKLLFGFLSDTSPIMGYRRKPYMLIGWLLASCSLFSLLLFSNLHVPPRNAGFFGNDQSADEATIPSDAPSIPFLALTLLGFGTGFWLADVMADSVVAEKAKLEPPNCRGSIQSSCYSYRFGALMVAAPISTYLYAKMGPYYVICLLSFVPLSILPLVYMLGEVQNAPIRPVREQCNEIWGTITSRAVWQPMGFVFLYNIMQVGNGAWREFLTTVLHFTSFQLNLILISAYVLLYLGIMAYKYCMMQWSWRKVYIVTTLLNGFFSALQVLLIYGFTFGLPSFWFALGDDAFSEFIQGIQFLPTTIMMVHLCPSGSEGASYAMFTTVNNSALTLSSILSTRLLTIWDVSTFALEAGNLSGMANLTYLTTIIQVSALAFVGFLPRFKEDLVELKNSQHSLMGGFAFLAVTALALIYSITIGTLNIVAPGWMGES